jgi:hypothetical protein
MALITSLSGCETHVDGPGENIMGAGISWTFNVTNQSGNAVTLKATPLRGHDNAKANDGAQFLDGPIDEESLPSGTSTTLVTRTGRFGPGFTTPSVLRSFTLEINGLASNPVIFYGWPQKESLGNINAQYYGLGYEIGPGEDAQKKGLYVFLLSSLAPGHHLLSDFIYNVIIKDTNTIEWSLDQKVKLTVLPPSPP